MKPIPISAARWVAQEFGYDQVVIMARRTDAIPIKLPLCNEPVESGEHITTYGINRAHCDVAALMGNTLKRIARWPTEQDVNALNTLYDELSSGTFDYMDYDATVAQVSALGRLLGK